MSTDHQTIEDHTAGTERGLGMIVTALIVLATLGTVVVIVIH